MSAFAPRRLLQHLSVITLCSLFLISPAWAGADRPTILVIGDSLSAGYGVDPGQGWVTLMEQQLQARSSWQVVNASISGDTSGGALQRLPQLLRAHAPQLVVVEIGGNDGLRGYPISMLRDNLAEIVRLCREAGSKVLMLGMRIPPNYGKRYTDQFQRSFEQVAEQLSVPLIPFILENIALDPALMQADGIHPNTDAQPLIVQNVLPRVEAMLN